MKVLKLSAIAANIEMLLAGFFDSTYNEHRGPIQLVHQIERIRSNPFFEDDAFYQMVVSEEFKRVGQFNPLDRALDVVAANTRTWHGTAIGRQIEMKAAGRWNNAYVTLGDTIWAAYLHIQSGGDGGARALRVLDDYLFAKIGEDDGVFYHGSEWNVNHLEGKTVLILVNEAIQRLKDVS